MTLMSHSVPLYHVEYYKDAAKTRLALLRAANPKAKLADAYNNLARESGCASWDVMKAKLGNSLAAPSVEIAALLSRAAGLRPSLSSPYIRHPNQDWLLSQIEAVAHRHLQGHPADEHPYRQIWINRSFVLLRAVSELMFWYGGGKLLTADWLAATDLRCILYMVAYDRSQPAPIRAALVEYARNLWGFPAFLIDYPILDLPNINSVDFAEETKRQHGYLTQQFIIHLYYWIDYDPEFLFDPALSQDMPKAPYMHFDFLRGLANEEKPQN
jgi:hypothetical protein